LEQLTLQIQSPGFFGLDSLLGSLSTVCSCKEQPTSSSYKWNHNLSSSTYAAQAYCRTIGVIGTGDFISTTMIRVYRDPSQWLACKHHAVNNRCKVFSTSVSMLQRVINIKLQL